MPADSRSLVIWRFSDGRRGHDSQSVGLLRALETLRACMHVDIPAASTLAGLRQVRIRLSERDDRLHRPDLLLGAGHATHIPMIAAQLARGGRSVVLMRPTLPLSWFDFCLIPEHDEPAAQRDNVIATEGPLTLPVPSTAREPDLGVILVGGPSRHFHWHPERLLEQIRNVLERNDRQWLLGDSPRTPADVYAALQALGGGKVRFVHFREQPAGWIGAQLARATAAWISCDSLSMIYEALSAGAALGVLELEPVQAGDKIWRAVERLARERMLTRYTCWIEGSPLLPAPRRLNEAARCAAVLTARLGLHDAPAVR